MISKHLFDVLFISWGFFVFPPPLMSSSEYKIFLELLIIILVDFKAFFCDFLIRKNFRIKLFFPLILFPPRMFYLKLNDASKSSLVSFLSRIYFSAFQDSRFDECHVQQDGKRSTNRFCLKGSFEAPWKSEWVCEGRVNLGKYLLSSLCLPPNIR